MTLLFGFAAVNTGNNLIFLIVATLLAFMSVSGVLGWLNIRGMNVHVEFPDEVYSGLDTLLTVRLQNSKRKFPAFLMKVAVLNQTVRYDLLACGEEGKSSFVFRFPNRGAYPIAVAEISSPFPINFFVRSRWVAVNRNVVVFPAPVPCAMPAGSCHTDKVWYHDR